MKRQRILLRALLGAVAWVALTSGAHANDDKDLNSGFLSQVELSDRGFRPLFIPEDKTLVNWKVSEIHAKHWVIRDGVIHYDGVCENLKGIERNLWTKRSFQDVQFFVEWRFPSPSTLRPKPIVLWNGDFLRDDSGKRISKLRPDAGDSGILFRGILNCQPNIWCQELGSGEVNGYRTNRKLPTRLRQSCLPFAFADNPIGEWNAFMITLKEDRLSVDLNGQKVLETERLPNLPAQGPIGLQHHGDPVQFRNIWVKEI